MLAAFSITPLGGGSGGGSADDSVSRQVAECVRIVRASGLSNETNAMFTNVEGDWDAVMQVIRDCVDVVLTEAPRASVVIKLDCRPGTENALAGKVAAVEAHLAPSADAE